ncbi:MAG: hypothetical protein KBT04_03700 [Bacteroidales bacterium]|nr:hypothetical protein [Candidatus Colimorpha onthohippi]
MDLTINHYDTPPNPKAGRHPSDSETDAAQPTPAADDTDETHNDKNEQTPDNNNSTSEARPEKESKRHALKRLLLNGEVLKQKAVLKQIPLLLLIIVCCILLIYNRYRVETLTNDKISTQKHIEQIREKRIQMKRQYQETIKISSIAKELDTIGIGLIAEPPCTIDITD